MQNKNIFRFTSYGFSGIENQRSFHRGQKREERHEGRRSLAKSESLDPWLGQKAKYHLPQREFDGKG